MVAVGITNKGKRLEFVCIDGILYCCDNDLVSLNIPEGVKTLSCENNLLTELFLPESVKKLWCDKEINGLKEFIDKIEIELW